jgi:hypothetical protein
VTDPPQRYGCAGWSVGARLAIVAKRAVQVWECDRCGQEPATTWVITGPDGTPREIELCDQHASPIANAYALARPVAGKTSRSVRARHDNRRPADAATTALEPEPIWR